MAPHYTDETDLYAGEMRVKQNRLHRGPRSLASPTYIPVDAPLSPESAPRHEEDSEY